MLQNLRRRDIKKSALIVVIGLFLCVSCYAQDKTVVPQPAQPEAEIKTMIYEYKAELGLTDEQEGDLRDVLGDYRDYFAEKNKKLSALQVELGEMIKSKEKLRKIRKQLENIARSQVDASCFDIETSRKVEGVLTSEQLAKWNTIQADFMNKLQERMKAAQTKEKI